MSTAKKKTEMMPAGAALSPYDTAEFLRTPEEIASYLEVVFEEYGDDPRMIAKALGNAARAQGMQKVAKVTGISREGLYQALSGKSNPGFDTVLKVLHAFGLEIRPKVVGRRKKTTAQEDMQAAFDRLARESKPAQVRRAANDTMPAGKRKRA